MCCVSSLLLLSLLLPLLLLFFFSCHHSTSIGLVAVRASVWVRCVYMHGCVRVYVLLSVCMCACLVAHTHHRIHTNRWVVLVLSRLFNNHYSTRHTYTQHIDVFFTRLHRMFGCVRVCAPVYVRRACVGVLFVILSISLALELIAICHSFSAPLRFLYAHQRILREWKFICIE